MRNLNYLLASTALVCLGLVALPQHMVAQGTDSVFLRPGKNGRTSVRRGNVTATSPNSVEITLSSGQKQQLVPGRIKKISFAGEPNQLGRARDRMNAGRYDDCLSELEKIENPPNAELVAQELDFLKAYCQAQKSLRGGDVTANQAGVAIRGYLSKYPNSFHFYEATLVLGQLLVAINKPDLAEIEFAKLAQSNWPEDVIKGHFHRGKALIHADKLQLAHDSFSAITKIDATDDVTQQFKMIAQCQLAKVMAMQGNFAAARPIVDKIIDEENADNTELFAYAYNALGHCHLKAQKPKEAAFAFMFTQLLFRSESDPHAEAIYNLTLIWRELEETDRANKTRALLKSRYRNTIWAPKLL